MYKTCLILDFAEFNQGDITETIDFFASRLPAPATISVCVVCREEQVPAILEARKEGIIAGFHTSVRLKDSEDMSWPQFIKQLAEEDGDDFNQIGFLNYSTPEIIHCTANKTVAILFPLSVANGYKAFLNGPISKHSIVRHNYFISTQAVKQMDFSCITSEREMLMEAAKIGVVETSYEQR